MRTIGIALLFALLAPLPALAAEGPVTGILRAIDHNYEMRTDGRADVTVTQQKVDQGTKVFGMQYFRRDADDSFLIVMTAPENEKGNGYLRVGDNFWMYRRNTRTFQHINRDESIGGTDARGDDFEERKMMEMYAPVLDPQGGEAIAEDRLGQVPVYRFEVRAKIEDVDYPKKIYWVRRDNSLILKEEAYSLSGTLMQTAYYLKYTQVQGAFVAVKFLVIDEFEKGNKTVVDIANISTRKLDDAIFTKPYLENLSK
ncbi:MAG: outer membrane lipoprotein-sorting protein [candidate division FCPU426 bacterium]